MTIKDLLSKDFSCKRTDHEKYITFQFFLGTKEFRIYKNIDHTEILREGTYCTEVLSMWVETNLKTHVENL